MFSYFIVPVLFTRPNGRRAFVVILMVASDVPRRPPHHGKIISYSSHAVLLAGTRATQNELHAQFLFYVRFGDFFKP